MISELESSNWLPDFMLEGKDKDPETLWASLKSKILELRNKFVPNKTTRTGKDCINKGSFPLDETVRKAIKEKHKLHRRWMKGVGNQTLREAYSKSCRKAKKLIRQSKRLFEKGLSDRSKKNPKEFWKYARSKLRTKTGVSPLLQDVDNPDSLKFGDKEKSDILQDQFCSVFTREQCDTIRIKDG